MQGGYQRMGKINDMLDRLLMAVFVEYFATTFSIIILLIILGFILLLRFTGSNG